MRVAIIAPLRLVHLSAVTDFHLGLAQLAHIDERYVMWHRARADMDCYVVLDNGAAEGAVPPTPPILLKSAKAMGAKEVVAPDALCKYRHTLNLTASFMAELHNAHFVPDQIMLVPQGQDYDEWLDCFQRMQDRWHGPNIVYGITRAVERLWTTPVDRFDIINRLVGSDQLLPGEQLHLLGVGNSLQSIRDLAASGLVRSIDTSLPIVAAQCGYELSAVRDRRIAELKYDPFESRCDEVLARRNIATFRRWCNDIR